MTSNAHLHQLARLDALRAALQAYAPIAARQPPTGDYDLNPDMQQALPPARPLTPAAVLVPIIDRPGQPTVLLTKRNARMRRHAGQIAFPGGRVDASDASAWAAALREAHEEVGIPARLIDPIGRIDEYETGTGYRISPFVAAVRPDFVLRLQADEVETAFEVPLIDVLDPTRHEQQETQWQGRMRRYFVIHSAEHRIWGATAGMLVNLARIVHAQHDESSRSGITLQGITTTGASPA